MIGYKSGLKCWDFHCFFRFLPCICWENKCFGFCPHSSSRGRGLRKIISSASAILPDSWLYFSQRERDLWPRNKWDITTCNGKTSHWMKNVCLRVKWYSWGKFLNSTLKKKQRHHESSFPITLKKKKQRVGIYLPSIQVSLLFIDLPSSSSPLPPKKAELKTKSASNCLH